MQRWENVSPEEWHALGRKLADEQDEPAWDHPRGVFHTVWRWVTHPAVLVLVAFYGTLLAGLWGGGFL